MNLLEKLMQFEIHNEDNPDIIAKFGAIHIALLSLASNKDRNHAEELLSASADVFLKLSENEMSEEGAEFQKVFDKNILKSKNELKTSLENKKNCITTTCRSHRRNVAW